MADPRLKTDAASFPRRPSGDFYFCFFTPQSLRSRGRKIRGGRTSTIFIYRLFRGGGNAPFLRSVICGGGRRSRRRGSRSRAGRSELRAGGTASGGSRRRTRARRPSAAIRFVYSISYWHLLPVYRICGIGRRGALSLLSYARRRGRFYAGAELRAAYRVFAFAKIYRHIRSFPDIPVLSNPSRVRARPLVWFFRPDPLTNRFLRAILRLVISKRYQNETHTRKEIKSWKKRY